MSSERIDDAREWYVDDEDAPPALRDLAKTADVFSVTFSSFGAMRVALYELLVGLGADAARLWIDSDYGWLMRGDEFCVLLEDPSWDWRTDVLPR